MKKSKAFLFCLSLLAVIACGHDDDENGGSGGGGNYTPQELVVKGKVEKGPFISGSVISMQPLNEKMQATGSSYTTTITDDYGSFTFNPEKFEEPYARLSVSGYFYNEYKGKLSQGQITLQSVVDVKDKSSVNVNLLTHLKYQRVLNLIDQGKNFTEANSQAQEELLTCFGLQSLNTADVSQFSIAAGTGESAALIVTSALLLGNRSEAEFTEYLAKLSTDFAEDGTVNEEHRKQLEKETADLYDKLDNISKNLIERYQQLGRRITVKPLVKYVDWNFDGILGNEYHDPNKPVTLSTSEIQVPMEGGTYKVTFSSDVPLYTSPQVPTFSPDITQSTQIHGPFTGGGSVISKDSIEGNTVTIEVMATQWKDDTKGYIPLYDYMGNVAAKINLIQAGNPNGKWLNNNGNYLALKISEFLLYRQRDLLQMYQTEIFGLSEDDINLYHLDDVLKTYALLACTWTQTRSAHYWNNAVPIEQTIIDLQKAIENLEERSASNCQTAEDLMRSSKDVARYILAYCYQYIGNQQQAQLLVNDILGSGRYDWNNPVLGIKDRPIISYDDVTNLTNNY
jgi:hypothetical protein